MGHDHRLRSTFPLPPAPAVQPHILEGQELGFVCLCLCSLLCSPQHMDEERHMDGLRHTGPGGAVPLRLRTLSGCLCGSVSGLSISLGPGDLSQSYSCYPSSVPSSKKAQGPQGCRRKEGKVYATGDVPRHPHVCVCLCIGLPEPVSSGVPGNSLGNRNIILRHPPNASPPLPGVCCGSATS